MDLVLAGVAFGIIAGIVKATLTMDAWDR